MISNRALLIAAVAATVIFASLVYANAVVPVTTCVWPNTCAM